MTDMDYSQEPSSAAPVIGGLSGSARSPRRLLKIALIGVAALVVVGGIIVGLQVFKSSDTATAISAISANATIAPAGVNPKTIQVKKGQPVTWTNQDVRPHRLTADQDALPGFDTVDMLNQGDSYTYVFENSGTFHYYDPADPKTYVGTVTVQ